MAGFKDLLGDGDAVKQILLWQVLGQIIAPILAPVVQDLQSTIYPDTLDIPASAAELADAVVRGEIAHDDARGLASQSGVAGHTFDLLVATTGEPPAVEQLLFLYRRQKISQDRLVHGIRQSRVKDEWIDAIEALGTVPISPADAIAAWVENQIPKEEALRIAYEGGLDEHSAQILHDTRGRPPGPAELLELVRRRIIPQGGTGPDVLSLDQGISESDIKDKWIPAFHALLEYLPPPRTVTALLRAGSITTEQARDLFEKSGLTPELAQAYIADASHQKLAAHKELAKGDVLSLYRAGVIDAAAAHGLIEQLGYTAQEVDWLLALEDLRRVQSQVTSAVNRIRSLFIGHRLSRAAASTVLDDLRIPSAQRDTLLADWDLERAANVKIPTVATVATAFKDGIIDQGTAQAELERQGYTPFDAWLELSVHLHQALPGQPPSSWPEPSS